MSNIMVTVRSYYAFYGNYFTGKWNHMGPAGYGILLIVVATFGWLLMKAGNKRA